MNSKELKSVICNRTGVPLSVVSLVLDTEYLEISNRLKAGEDVDLGRIIRLSTDTRTFNVRHPQTKMPYTVIRTVLVSKAKHRLKEFLNGKIRSIYQSTK